MFPVNAHPSHGGDNQQWYKGDDGSESRRWVRRAFDGYHSWLFESGTTGRCVTHNGAYQELVLTPCESGRYDQRWIVHL